MTLNTFRLAEGDIEVNALCGIPVRGMEDPVEAFDLKGAVDFRSCFLAATPKLRYLSRHGRKRGKALLANGIA